MGRRRVAGLLVICVLVMGGVSRRITGQGRTTAAGLQSPRSEEVKSLEQQFDQMFSESRFDEALTVGERALAIVEKELGREHPDVVVYLLRIASVYTMKDDAARAQSLYKRVALIREKARTQEEAKLEAQYPGLKEAQSLDEQFDKLVGEGKNGEVLSVAERAVALHIKAQGPEHPDVAKALARLALVYIENGDYLNSDVAVQRALAVGEKAFGPDHPDFLPLIVNFAAMYDKKSEEGRAEALLQRALALNLKAWVEDPVLATWLDGLAHKYREKGDYGRAVQIYQHTLAILEKTWGPENPAVVGPLNNMSSLYWVVGDYDRAEQLAKRSLTVSEKQMATKRWDYVSSLSTLGLVYQAKHDYTQAAQLFQRSLAILEKDVGPAHPAVANLLNNLAAVHSEEGDIERAEPLLLRALAIYEKVYGAQHLELTVTLSNLADIYRVRGDFGRAESLLRRNLAIREKSQAPRHSDIASSLSNHAILYTAKGDVAQAVRFRIRANDIREDNLALLLSTGSEEQKRLYMLTISNETDATVSLHASSAPHDSDAARLALTTILRRKGRVLDVMGDQITALRRRLNPHDRSLLEQLSAARSQLATLTQKGTDKTSSEERQAAMLQLEEEVQRLEAVVSARSVQFHILSQPVTLERVQAAIPATATLVELVSYRVLDAKAKRSERFGPRQYVAYAMRREGAPEWVRLGDADAIDKKVIALRKSLSDPASKNVKKTARDLDELVMRPVRRLLGDTKHILLSPDGALNLIPFSALVDENEHYLVESYTITYLTSGRDLQSLQENQESRQPSLVLADPLFGLAHTTEVSPARGASARRSADMGQMFFNRLPGTASEAKALGAILPRVKVLTQEAATESALKQINGPRILHVATHGFFLPDEPRAGAEGTRGVSLGASGASQRRVAWQKDNPLLRSGLALEGANQKRGMGGGDGILTALEVAGLDLWGTKLVVLSACETGVGDVSNGEGVYGLRRALVLAGSESQVMSLWQVSDAATRDLMVAYYKRLMVGEGRTEALRAVQLEMLGVANLALSDHRRGLRLTPSNKGVNYSHPFFWAAFIQSGDWRGMGGQVRPAN